MKRGTLPYNSFKRYAIAYLPPGGEEYFLKRFNEIEQNKQYFRFNLAAAFWSFFWFWYHKMYLAGFVVMALFLGVDALLDVLLKGVCLTPATDGLVRFFAPMVLSAITVGFSADFLYWYHCRRRINRLWVKYGSTMADVGFTALLKRRGGTQLTKLIFIGGTIMGLLVATFAYLWLEDPKLAEQTFKEALSPQSHTTQTCTTP